MTAAVWIRTGESAGTHVGGENELSSLDMRLDEAADRHAWRRRQIEGSGYRTAVGETRR